MRTEAEIRKCLTFIQAKCARAERKRLACSRELFDEDQHWRRVVDVTSQGAQALAWVLGMKEIETGGQVHKLPKNPWAQSWVRKIEAETWPR